MGLIIKDLNSLEHVFSYHCLNVLRHYTLPDLNRESEILNQYKSTNCSLKLKLFWLNMKMKLIIVGGKR